MRRAGVVLAWIASACTPETPRGSCFFWSDCGEGGACEYTAPVAGETSRFECSFADDACESGRRFGEFASPARAGECVAFAPGLGGICDPAHDCGEGVECQLGRCVNVRQLDATAEAFVGLCSDHLRAGGDVYLWGFALEIIPDMPIAVGVFLDAAPLTAINAAMTPPPTTIETTQVTMGANHLCALGATGDGTAFSACLGRNNDPAIGVDPDGVPTIFGSDNPFGLHSQLSASSSHTCGVQARNVDCWGSNLDRQLDGTANTSQLEARVAMQAQITAVTTGKTFTCAGTTQDVSCWGGDHWALDTFGANDGSVATVLGIPPGMTTALDAGEAHACAIVDTRLWCWGVNDSGQVTGATSVQPQRAAQPLADTPVLAIAVGRAHTCAVTAEHAVVCWGSNDVGQLGQDTSSRAPQVVPLDARAVGPIAATDDATCALLEDSFVHCWGTPQLTTEAQPLPLERFPICVL